jgi:hypothetical protein
MHSRTANGRRSPSGPPANGSGTEVVWGAQAIGAVVGLTPSQAFHALSSGHLPGVKIGGKWSARRDLLLQAFEPSQAK